jgi:hypothetical protein
MQGSEGCGSTFTQPKPPAFQNIPLTFRNQTKNSFYIMAKSRKPFSLQLKRPTFCNFAGLKAEEGKTMITNYNVFRDYESCMSKRQLGSKVYPEYFSNHGAKISSTL